jgi:hypothetical protein
MLEIWQLSGSGSPRAQMLLFIVAVFLNRTSINFKPVIFSAFQSGSFCQFKLSRFYQASSKKMLPFVLNLAPNARY